MNEEELTDLMHTMSAAASSMMDAARGIAEYLKSKPAHSNDLLNALSDMENMLHVYSDHASAVEEFLDERLSEEGLEQRIGTLF